MSDIPTFEPEDIIIDDVATHPREPSHNSNLNPNLNVPEELIPCGSSTSLFVPADPTEIAEPEVDKKKLAQLLELGFDELISVISLRRNRDLSLEVAIDWIVEHSNPSDLESAYSDEDENTKFNEEEIAELMGSNWSAESSPVVQDKNLAGILRALRPPRSHKMVFVANMSLKMGVGKLAAQVGHATLAVFRVAQRTQEGIEALETWNNHGAVKIVVKGHSTEHLIDLYKLARDNNVHAYLVQDAGYTQIPPGSRTILGLFGPVEEVDKVTGALKLL